MRLTYTGHYDANHLLSLADQPLLGELVANCAPLVIFSGNVATDTQCTSLVSQQMQRAFISGPRAQSPLFHLILR